MPEPDRIARFEIQIFYNANTGQRELLDGLFDDVADLIHPWGEEHGIDLFMSGTMSEHISESPPKQDPPPTDPLVREAESMHEIVIVNLVNEVIIVCDTCADEIGAKMDEITLNEILSCVDLHVNGPPDIDCVTLPDGSCVADPCRIHDPRPEPAPKPVCTGNPCICTNGIGCTTIPYEKW